MSRARALLVLLAVAAGCVAGSRRTPEWSEPPLPFGDVSDDIVAGLVSSGDQAWQQREKPDMLDEARRSYSAALRYRPSDANILVRLARVSMRRAHAMSSSTAAAQYDEAVRYAERALTARNPALAAAARAGKDPVAVFSHAEPADADALVVYAEALLDWAVVRGTATVLAQKDWIAAAATRVLGFDRALGWAAPDRVLGILECELPEARQNLHDALERFEAAVAAAPAYLPTRLAYAEEYATRVRDAALYQRLLQEVVAADPQALPEAAPENADAQRAARRLLHRR